MEKDFFLKPICWFKLLEVDTWLALVTDSIIVLSSLNRDWEVTLLSKGCCFVFGELIIGGLVCSFGLFILFWKDLPHLYLKGFTSDSDFDLTLKLFVD